MEYFANQNKHSFDNRVKSEVLSRMDTNRANTKNPTAVASPSKHIKKFDKDENPRKDYKKLSTFGRKKKETTKNGLELQFFHKTKICPF